MGVRMAHALTHFVPSSGPLIDFCRTNIPPDTTTVKLVSWCRGFLRLSTQLFHNTALQYGTVIGANNDVIMMAIKNKSWSTPPKVHYDDETGQI